MHDRSGTKAIRAYLALGAIPLLLSMRGAAQTAVPAGAAQGNPIAIVPIDSSLGGGAAAVTGALKVTAGKAIIAASGSVTAGSRTTNVVLPHRGTLRVCASTTVSLAADTSVPEGATPGLLMAMDHGAVEMSFANTAAASNADVLMTPDFRILVSGPGASEVKVRLGRGGDTCVDNSGTDAPYVVVTSQFESGLYRVQPGQRVMFQRGNLREVVDHEKEPCGCPPPQPKTPSNEFPLAQSEGLAPTPPPTLAPVEGSSAAQTVPPLVYSSAEHAPVAGAPAQQSVTPTAASAPVPANPPAAKKPGVLKRLGRFFKRIFGAE